MWLRAIAPGTAVCVVDLGHMVGTAVGVSPAICLVGLAVGGGSSVGSVVEVRVGSCHAISGVLGLQAVIPKATSKRKSHFFLETLQKHSWLQKMVLHGRESGSIFGD